MSRTSQRLNALTGLCQNGGADATIAQQQAIASLAQLVNTQAAILLDNHIYKRGF
jgi:MFS transporter, DHA2 family, multidrug resistance protein